MSENKIRLNIVTPSRMLYNDKVDMVIMRSTSGDLGILAGHQPLTTTLDYGVLRIINNGEEIKSTLFGGFADVQPECLTVLTDAAEWPDEIDKQRAEQAKKRAEERLNKGGKDINIEKAELALRRALIRLEVSDK